MIPLAFLSPSFGEMMLIVIIALLLYGSDLPKVARTWGKHYQDFRRHLSGMQRELNDAMYAEEETPRRLQYYPEFRDETTTADAVSEEAGHSPVADAALAEGEAAQIADGDRVSQNGAAIHDAHGAA
jgi:sec-independent protein translocase protein TatA